ncbi:MAG TPA: hypothetical protein VMW01_06430 [Williamwhitmania sp.]|nr:hypothetical protein [Williamwhitmania sp.]
MEIRTKIWNFLNDSKTNECFSSLILKHYQKLDLSLNLFLVFTTTSSVAAWAIWKEFPLLWALIIAISQVITIAKPYFLFPKYIKVFYEKNILWQQLSLELEELWHNTNYSIIDEPEASRIYFELRKKCIIFDKVPEDIIFFDFKNFQTEAEKQCNYYTQKIN